MHRTALRLRLLLIVAPIAHGCSSTATNGDVPATSTEGRTWFEGKALCVRAADTDSGHSSMKDPDLNCGLGLSPEARDSVRDESKVCRKCSYGFSRQATEQTRRQHPDGCCFEAEYVMIGRPLVIAANWRKAPLVCGMAWSA